MAETTDLWAASLGVVVFAALRVVVASRKPIGHRTLTEPEAVVLR